MEWVVQFRPPIPRPDLDQIQSLLQETDPFVPAVSLSSPYDVVCYLPLQWIKRTQFCLFVDRNIITRWTSLLSGKRASSNDRRAAAVLVFSHVAGFDVESTVAFWELAATGDERSTQEEANAFNNIASLDAAKWTDIALGRRAKLRPLPQAESSTRTSIKTVDGYYLWQRNYALALKIAELHLLRGKGEMLMTQFLQWMYDEFVIGAPAVQLASYYFAPGAPRRGLLKNIESPDREKALAGLRNAAWDMTLISEWLSRVKLHVSGGMSQRAHILCTLDKSVRRMAHGILSYDDPPDSDYDRLTRVFSDIWDSETGERLASVLAEYQSALNNPSRSLNKLRYASAVIPEMISRGESAIRAWNPRRPSA